MKSLILLTVLGAAMAGVLQETEENADDKRIWGQTMDIWGKRAWGNSLDAWGKRDAPEEELTDKKTWGSSMDLWGKRNTESVSMFERQIPLLGMKTIRRFDEDGDSKLNSEELNVFIAWLLDV